MPPEVQLTVFWAPSGQCPFDGAREYHFLRGADGDDDLLRFARVESPADTIEFDHATRVWKSRIGELTLVSEASVMSSSRIVHLELRSKEPGGPWGLMTYEVGH